MYWSITGVGEARNRTRLAVERTVPFGLVTQSLVIICFLLTDPATTETRANTQTAN